MNTILQINFCEPDGDILAFLTGQVEKFIFVGFV